MTTCEWPVLHIRFSSRPPQEQWETLCALAEVEFDIFAIDELGSPARAPEVGGPLEARFFLAAVDGQQTLSDCVARLQSLVSSFAPGIETHIEGLFLPEKDWTVEWKKHFFTTRVGERLYVGPPWDRLPDDAPPDAIMILVEPGQAFGTGTHETTKLCLRVLEEHVKPGGCLLDMGAGSGILGFAAVRLGAACVLGAEFDPVCEENFLLNARLNEVADRLHFLLSSSPGEAVRLAAERALPSPTLIVCNMLSERFLPHMAGFRALGVPLILSGYLMTEFPTVRNEVASHRYRMTNSYEMGEWGACVCVPVP